MTKFKAFCTVILLILIMNCTTLVKAEVLVERFGGVDRYDTSIKIARAGWTVSPNVVLTFGGDFPDSLSAVPLAKKYNAPILLTKKSELSSEITQCLKDLKVSNVIIVGGNGVVSTNIETTLKTMGISVNRIAGKDRYSTSLEVAKRLVSDYTISNKDIYLVSGDNFPDALSITSVAAKKQRPILLINKNYIPTAVQSFLKNKCVKPNIYIIGGTGVISENTLNTLKTTTPNNVTRISGPNRYSTNFEVIRLFYPTLELNNLSMASGEDFPDALAGTAYGSKNDSPLVLVSNKISHDTYFFFEYRRYFKLKKLTVFGGLSVINDSVLENLQYIEPANNSYANYNNGGLALKIDNYIYFRNNSQWAKFCRMNLDGSNVKVISPIDNIYANLTPSQSFITGLGNRLYINTRSQSDTVLYADILEPYGTGPDLANHKIYFKGDKMYTTDNSITEVEDVNTGIKKVFSTEPAVDLFFYLDNVYYKHSNYGSKVYKQNLINKAIVEVTKGNVDKFNIYNNEIYFVDEEDKKLYKTDLDGGNKQLVIEDQLSDLNISNGWIYYANASDGKSLYKIKVDGTSKTKLNDISTTKINVVDNWIFYFREFSAYYGNELYQMNIDGTLNKQI